MISAENLHKYFGEFHAVRGISLEVRPGEVLALLGPNGAGKSTTVRMLTAILQPTHGRASIAGYDVTNEPQHVRAQVGLLTEYPGLYLRMTALKYLLFFARLQGLPSAEATPRAEELLRRFGLWEARSRKLDSYSKGMQQKVALIRSMLHNPQVLFLDEPTTAMDPQSAHVVRDAISALRDERRVIVLCTHNLAEAEALADRIAVVYGGRIAAEGTVNELSRMWLGDPVWELTATGPLYEVLERLRGFVAVELISPTCFRYRTADARHMNPMILERLRDAGVAVMSLSEVPRSLESVYLQIVGDAEPEREDVLVLPRKAAVEVGL
jgi:ABC-2 type transport system ATP-binding protein